mgnify:FL=1
MHIISFKNVIKACACITAIAKTVEQVAHCVTNQSVIDMIHNIGTIWG